MLMSFSYTVKPSNALTMLGVSAAVNSEGNFDWKCCRQAWNKAHRRCKDSLATNLLIKFEQHNLNKKLDAVRNQYKPSINADHCIWFPHLRGQAFIVAFHALAKVLKNHRRVGELCSPRAQVTIGAAIVSIEAALRNRFMQNIFLHGVLPYLLVENTLDFGTSHPTPNMLGKFLKSHYASNSTCCLESWPSSTNDRQPVCRIPWRDATLLQILPCLLSMLQRLQKLWPMPAVQNRRHESEDG